MAQCNGAGADLDVQDVISFDEILATEEGPVDASDLLNGNMESVSDDDAEEFTESTSSITTIQVEIHSI